MRFEDLPKAVQARVRAEHDVTPARTRTSQHAAPTAGGRWRCGTDGCPATFTQLAPAERHADLPGHHRIEVVL